MISTRPAQSFAHDLPSAMNSGSASSSSISTQLLVSSSVPLPSSARFRFLGLDPSELNVTASAGGGGGSTTLPLPFTSFLIPPPACPFAKSPDPLFLALRLMLCDPASELSGIELPFRFKVEGPTPLSSSSESESVVKSTAFCVLLRPKVWTLDPSRRRFVGCRLTVEL